MTTVVADTISGVAEDKFLLRLPEGLKPRLEKLAKTEDRSLNAQVVRVLREWADQAERGERKPAAQRARSVSISHDLLQVNLYGRGAVAAPLAWFPRLVAATEEQRQNFTLIGGGVGIHWPDLDETISIESLLDLLKANGM